MNLCSLFLFLCFLCFCVCYDDMSPEAVTVYENPNIASFRHTPYKYDYENYMSSDSNLDPEESELGYDNYQHPTEYEDYKYPVEYEEYKYPVEYENYKYPGETKQDEKNEKRGGGRFDKHPEFEHDPRNVERDPNYRPSKGRGPYGHPKYANKEKYRHDHLNPEAVDNGEEEEESLHNSLAQNAEKARAGGSEKKPKQKRKKTPKVVYNKYYLINADNPDHLLLFHYLNQKRKPKKEDTEHLYKNARSQYKSNSVLADQVKQIPTRGDPLWKEQHRRQSYKYSHDQDMDYEHVPEETGTQQNRIPRRTETAN